MSDKPILPHGSPSIFSGLSESFGFHTSPESFITSRVLAFRKAKPDLADARTPIHARILNRNVAVVSAYHHVRQILDDPKIASSTSADLAYDELMAPFFPPPNLLLLDPPAHRVLKERWLKRMDALHGDLTPRLDSIIYDHFRKIPSGSSIDIYDSMKDLSWSILLRIFLQNKQDLHVEDTVKIEKLQEDLLRGQFSLLPVSVNTRVWCSPRTKGLAARRGLESLLNSKIIRGKCPFSIDNVEEGQDVASHLLLFTSSLAAKALASYLTAVMLNVFVLKDGPKQTSLASKLVEISESSQRSRCVKNVLLETERLSPPVVGIMRRTTRDIVIDGQATSTERNSSPPVLIPKDWDLWLYFVGAARDPSAFGDTAEMFDPERFEAGGNHTGQQGFAFGSGEKTCLGRSLVTSIATAVLDACLAPRNDLGSAQAPSVSLRGEADKIPGGVRGWLGWEASVKPEQWAKHMKQLPTQRPRKPVMLAVHHYLKP